MEETIDPPGGVGASTGEAGVLEREEVAGRDERDDCWLTAEDTSSAEATLLQAS